MNYETNVAPIAEMVVRVPASTLAELEKHAAAVGNGYTLQNAVSTVLMDWAIQRREAGKNGGIEHG